MCKKSKEQAVFYLDKVGLVKNAQVYPEQLWGEQKQRDAIAHRLCINPLMMSGDKSSSTLNLSRVGEVLQIMQQLGEEGIKMRGVTRKMQFIREVADRVTLYG